ncbi:MAG: hypothetical protein IKA99_01165, partial [Clostridia bacterium]|nr:hypothetical protein [Clostridia bacterium]
EDIKTIVLSAGGKTAQSKKVTDLLVDASNAIFKGEGIVKSLNPFVERVLGDAGAIGLENSIKDELMKIEQEIEKNLSLDFILSRGEYFYSKLFSAYYGLPFVDSASLIGFYKDGSLNMGLSQFQINRAYEKYGKFVCGGFYGALPNGEIKTFTRGGGDFSGAIVAKSLCARQYVNFTDVDGIFPFAPSEKVSEPIKEISFDKMRLLGEFGASVLHPASVLPLYGTETEILVKNTFNKSAEGTKVKENSFETPFAVAIKEKCVYCKMVKRGKGYNLANLIDGNYAKVICQVSSLDFLQVCFSGSWKEEFKHKGLDFCQVQEDVTVFYLTPCETSSNLVAKVQKIAGVLLVGVFDCGVYIATIGEGVKSVKKLIYEG